MLHWDKGGWIFLNFLLSGLAEFFLFLLFYLFS